MVRTIQTLIAVIAFVLLSSCSKESNPVVSETTSCSPDFSIGPYPSAIDLIVGGLEKWSSIYNPNVIDGAGQGYLLYTIGTVLSLTDCDALFDRARLVQLANEEITDLRGAAYETDIVGPGFGLGREWDAFQDGSVNPATTAYVWESGLAALGIGNYLAHISVSERSETDLSFLKALIDAWEPYFTWVTPETGFYWYSNKEADAIAVHNTCALLAMASQLYAEMTGVQSYAVKPKPEFTNEVQHSITVLSWESDIVNLPSKSGVRLPVYKPRAPRSGKSLQVWVARHRPLLGS